MRNRTVLLVAVLVLGTIGGPAAGVVGAQATLTVSVVTGAGDPVSNAELTLTWDGGSTTATTAGNGKAFVDVPDGVDVTIEVSHPAYTINTPVEVTDASTREVDITVYQKSTATLTIVDEDGPVEGVRVVLRKQGEVVGVHSTNSQGTIKSGVIEAGDYTVNLFEPGYYEKQVGLTIRGDTSRELSIRGGSVTVEFLVRDTNFGPPRPVPDVTIRGPDFSVATGSDGRREVSLPVNTELTVIVEKEGFETVRRVIRVSEQDKRINVSTRKLDAVNIEVPNKRVVVGESLRVTVTDQYGEPLTEATVYLDGQSVGQPNEEGLLDVPIESAGDHTLVAEMDQVSSERLTITGVESGADTSGDDSGANADTSDSTAQPRGFLALPAVGQIHLRSLAIGTVFGLIVAAFMFVYSRVG